MKPIHTLFIGSLAALLIACPKVEINQQRAGELRAIGGPALFGTTTFLRGAPVTASAIGHRLEQMGRSYPKLETFLERTMPKLNASSLFSNARVQAGTGSNCGANAADYVDADNDGIIVKAGTTSTAFSYTFDCASGGYNDQLGSLSGTVTIRDFDDTSAVSGYSVGMNNFVFSYGGSFTDTNGQTFTALLTLTLNFNTTVTPQAGGTYRVSQSYSFGVKAVAGTDSLEATFSDNSTLTYQPASVATASDAFARGTLNATDAFSYSIAVHTATDSGSDSGSLKLQLVNIYVDNGSCPDGITLNPSAVSGRAIFSDDSGNKLTWDVIGCGEGIWAYNSNPVF